MPNNVYYVTADWILMKIFSLAQFHRFNFRFESKLTFSPQPIELFKGPTFDTIEYQLRFAIWDGII